MVTYSSLSKKEKYNRKDFLKIKKKLLTKAESCGNIKSAVAKKAAKRFEKNQKKVLTRVGKCGSIYLADSQKVNKDNLDN